MPNKYATRPHIATMFQLAKAKGWSHEDLAPVLAEKAHDEEVASHALFVDAMEDVRRVLMNHPPGTVASIEGVAYWLAVYRDEKTSRHTVNLTSSSLYKDFVEDDDVRFVRDYEGLGAVDYDRITASIRAWLERRAYLEFPAERLDEVVARAYPKS
ncbi:MAG: hypothetical protein K5880_22080 [Hydrogenophaga sp.]|uniref:hypothetical protein n=1 Tax=Hydrogenophaga sp. TaxID=1904254 RepID=UPI002630E33F|nr:hypothetical protein [Hydrogenophaga sp.]MCV0441292.1 hypothetical protein [Hydrogenophaga sp.]